MLYLGDPYMCTWKECVFRCLEVDCFINVDYVMLIRSVIHIFYILTDGSFVLPVTERGVFKSTIIIMDVHFSFEFCQFLPCIIR